MPTFAVACQNATQEIARLAPQATAIYLLSDRYDLLPTLQKACGTKPVLMLGQRFHQVLAQESTNIDQMYANWTQRRRSLSFWHSHMASRNVASTPFLRHATYLLCARQIAGEGGSPLFIVETPALALSLKENLDPQALWHWRWRYARQLFGYAGKWILRSGYFFLQQFYWQARLRLESPPRPRAGSRPMILLRTWVTKGCYQEKGDGTFHFLDRNFGEFAEHLEKQGYQVWRLPMFFNVGENQLSVWRKLWRSDARLVCAEALLTPLDTVKTWCRSLGEIFLPTKELSLRGLHLRRLARASLWRTALTPDLMGLNTITSLMSGWRAQGVDWHAFYYPIENNAPEKTFVLAARKYHPKTPCLGFQHTIWVKEQFAMRLAESDLVHMPLPDRVFLSGAIYAEALAQTGWPTELIKLGANLRYQDVPKSPMQEIPPLHPVLLLILNFNLAQSLEAMQRVLTALQVPTLSQVRLHIKPHPLLPLSRLQDFARQHAGVALYEFVSGKVQDCALQASAVTIAGGSVSALEVLAMAIPVIRLSLSSDFDLDCIWSAAAGTELVADASQLEAGLQRFLHLGPEERQALKKEALNIRRDYFAEVSQQTLKNLESPPGLDR